MCDDERPATKPFNVAAVAGARLTWVGFTMDYMALGFDEKFGLTCYVWPEINVNGTLITEGMNGYTDRLCAELGSLVCEADDSDDDVISIAFASGTVIRIPLYHLAEGQDRAILGGPGSQFVTY